MKSKLAICASLFAITLSGSAFAAGGPMYEDLTTLAAPSQRAVEAGKAGNAAVFQTEAEAALQEAKSKTDSAAQQRVSGKLKRAVAAGKSGDLATGIQLIEEAMGDMKKSGAPKFGGGS